MWYLNVLKKFLILLVIMNIGYSKEFNMDLHIKLLQHGTIANITLQHTTFEDVKNMHGFSFKDYLIKKPTIEGVVKERLLCIENNNSYIIFGATQIPGDFMDIDNYRVDIKKPSDVKNLICHKVKKAINTYLGYSREKIISIFGLDYKENFSESNTIFYETLEPSFIYQLHGSRFKNKFDIPIWRFIKFKFKNNKVIDYDYGYYLST